MVYLTEDQKVIERIDGFFCMAISISSFCRYSDESISASPQPNSQHVTIHGQCMPQMVLSIFTLNVVGESQDRPDICKTGQPNRSVIPSIVGEKPL